MAAFAAASVFVLPSYSENFGIALVEALAAGLPCVTTEGVAVAADIRLQAAGLVVPAEAVALADSLLTLLSDDDLRSRLADSARRLARMDYSLEAMGSNLSKLYFAVLNARNPSLQHS